MIFVLEILFVIPLLIWFFSNINQYIYNLPIITILFTAAGVFFVSPGYILVIIYAIVLFILIIEKAKTLKVNIYIPILYIYMLVMVLFSTNVYGSITELHKFIFILMMYPIGYVYFKNYDQLKLLNNAVTIVAVIFILNFIISNLFNLGTADYFELYSGTLSRVHSHIGALFVVLVPLIFTLQKRTFFFNKYFVLLIGVLCFLILFLLMRRAPILLMVSGIAVIFLFVNLFKKQNLIASIPIVLISIFALIYWSDSIISRFEGRGMVLSAETIYIVDQLEREGRSREVFAVNDEIFNFENPAISFFGKEILNEDYTEGRYVSYSDQQFARAGRDRSAHTSYTRYLSGTGIVGLILYVFVMFRMFTSFQKIVKKISDKKNKQVFLIATFYALFVLSILEWYSSSYFHLTHMPLLFLYLGAINGVLKNENKKQLLLKKIFNK